MKPINSIFVAIDTTNLAKALDLASNLSGYVGGIKLGKEFFTAHGLAGVQKIASVGLPIFLDLKFHDIPNTVSGAIKAALKIKPFLINVHASGGREMLKAAVDTVKTNSPDTILIGVTLLTSLGRQDLKELGVNRSIQNHVIRLATLCQESGLDGIVCSAKEIALVKDACGKNFKTIVPGVRPVWANKNDQQRVVTPSNAIKRGADYIVIGRPITNATNPCEAAEKISEEISGINSNDDN